MLFGKKKITDGSVPLKYKKGKIKSGVYRSECLGYCVKIERGLQVEEKNPYSNTRDKENIIDFWGNLPSGVSIGAEYIICDGTVEIPDNSMRETLGRVMEQERQKRLPQGAESAYLGLVNFCGKPCCHAKMSQKVNGKEVTHEFYTYLSPYYMLMFSIHYSEDNSWYIDEAKALFTALN